MRAICLAVIACLVCTTSAFADADKIVTDDLGNTVAVPKEPTRIVSLFGALITVPLFELGAPVVGTTGDLGSISAAGTEWGITGFRELFGQSAKDAGLINVGSSEALDIEAIQALEPDLIVLSDDMRAQAARLKGLAPIFHIQLLDDQSFGTNVQERLAALVGKSTRYEALRKTYSTRLSILKTKLVTETKTKSVSAFIVWDQIYPLTRLSGISQVLHDLELDLTPISKGDNNLSVPVSSEKLLEFEADLVLLLGGFGQPDEGEQGTRASLDGIVPGWDRFLPAAREDRLIFMQSTPVISPSLASANWALDVFEEYLNRNGAE